MAASPSRTVEGVVLSTVCHKSRNGKGPHSFALTVSSSQTGKAITVRIPTNEPPLPGTLVRIRGTVQQTPFMTFLQASGDNDIKVLSGQQGAVLRDVVCNLLSHLGIAFDEQAAHQVLMDKDTHLCRLDRDEFLKLLEDKIKIPHIKTVFEDNEDLFASSLTKAMMEGLSKINVPFVADRRFELPFKKGVWPDHVMQGTVLRPQGGIDFLKTIEGREQHPCMRKGTRFYLHEHLPHEAIDNFFRALSIATEPSIYHYWMQEARRDSMVTQAFIRDKQKEGVQLFTAELMKRLESGFGIYNPDQVAARLGSMFKIELPNVEGGALIPMGTYQSASQIGQLTKMANRMIPLGSTPDRPHGPGMVPNTAGMDEYQAAGLMNFVKGYPLTLVAGPPGSGKSHTISRFIEACWQADEDVMILTPTGKAGSRLNQSFVQSFQGNSRRPVAVTLHSMFYAPENREGGGRLSLSLFSISQALDSAASEMFPTRVDRSVMFTTINDKKTQTTNFKSKKTLYSEMAPPPILAGKVVIIDEASMITNDQLALIMAMRPKRLVLTGDPWQLPPVGAGRPFQDLIELARDGYLKDKMALTDLKIDHRATQELAACTKLVRGIYDDEGKMVQAGQLPLDRVLEVDATVDSKAVAKSLMDSEFGIVQSAGLPDAMRVIQDVFAQELAESKPFYRFHYLGDYDRSMRDPESINLVLPMRLAKGISAARATMPDIMAMAYTNDEVQRLGGQIKAQLRPNNEIGDKFHLVSQLSPLVSNDLIPGDMVMQSKNDKAKIEYTTPQGQRKHSGSMNGESFLWVGSNVWLPLPSTRNTLDIDFKVNNLWAATGLREYVMGEIDQGRGDDPNFHLELYETLLGSKKEKEADALRRMALAEMVMIDSSQLLDLKLKPGGTYDLHPDMLKTMVLLPRLPLDKGMQNNDVGSFGLARDVFKVSQPGYVRKSDSLSEKEQYNELASDTQSNMGNFIIGVTNTVHKAQGSQGKISISLVPPPPRPETAYFHKNGAYTAITRAKEKALVFVYGMTVPEVNGLWREMDLRNAQLPSANKSVAMGLISPLCETLQMSTATLADERDRMGSMYQSRSRSADLFRRRTLNTAMGLPSGLDYEDIPPSHREMFISSEPNMMKHSPNMLASYPDMDRLLMPMEVPENILQMKQERSKWMSNMVNKMMETEELAPEEQQTKKEAANESLANDIDDIMDMDFDML